MLRWLPGADEATRTDGERHVRRALELFEKYVSVTQRSGVTIAVSELDGLEIAVVYHRDLNTADRIAGRLRKTGVAAFGSSGSKHAEVALFEAEPGITALGISNINGPCPACERHFGETSPGFSSVYWDDDAWIFP